MPRARYMVAFVLLAVAVPWLRGQMPDLAQAQADDILAVPDPVAVSLDARTTAFLAIDILDSSCASSGRSAQSCVASLSAVAAGLAAARAANALVVYAVHPAPDNVILPDVAPLPDEIVFVAAPGGDKFFNSSLDDILKQGGITTLVITGFSSNANEAFKP